MNDCRPFVEMELDVVHKAQPFRLELGTDIVGPDVDDPGRRQRRNEGMQARQGGLAVAGIGQGAIFE